MGAHHLLKSIVAAYRIFPRPIKKAGSNSYAVKACKPASLFIASCISLRCTESSLGAVMPSLTFSPRISTILISILLSMITLSSLVLLNTNILTPFRNNYPFIISAILCQMQICSFSKLAGRILTYSLRRQYQYLVLPAITVISHRLQIPLTHFLLSVMTPAAPSELSIAFIKPYFLQFVNNKIIFFIFFLGCGISCL